METDNTRKRIVEKLSILNIRFEYLTKSTQFWLETIEELFQAKIELINTNITSLKSLSFDISSIAKELHTSRQNLYKSHDGVLKQYIELRLKDIPTTPFQEIERIKDEKNSLQRDKDLLILKDVKTEALLHQLDEMSIKLDNAAKKHEFDFKRISELESELLQTKKELANLKNKQDMNKQIIF